MRLIQFCLLCLFFGSLTANQVVIRDIEKRSVTSMVKRSKKLDKIDDYEHGGEDLIDFNLDEDINIQALQKSRFLQFLASIQGFFINFQRYLSNWWHNKSLKKTHIKRF